MRLPGTLKMVVGLLVTAAVVSLTLPTCLTATHCHSALVASSTPCVVPTAPPLLTLPGHSDDVLLSPPAPLPLSPGTQSQQLRILKASHSHHEDQPAAMGYAELPMEPRNDVAPAAIVAAAPPHSIDLAAVHT